MVRELSAKMKAWQKLVKEELDKQTGKKSLKAAIQAAKKRKGELEKEAD